MPSAETPAQARDPFDAAAGVLAGAALVALVNAGAWVAIPLSAAGLGLRLTSGAFDVAETLGLGCVGALVAWAFTRYVRRPAYAGVAACYAFGAALVYVVVGDYLDLQAEHALDGRVEPLIRANYYFLFGGVFAAVPQLARVLRRWPRLWPLPIVIGLLGLVANQCFLRDDYFGIHGLVAVGGALVAGPALAPFVRRAWEDPARTTRVRLAVAALGLAGALGLAVPPSNAVRCELFRVPTAIGPWTLATLYWRLPEVRTVAPDSPWDHDRSGRPAIAPSRPALLPEDPVVVLVTIDALRADVVASPAYAARLPTLTRLQQEGVVFTHASAAGTQTPLSLGTLFSSLYFSQQRWTDHGVGGDRFPYPADDATYPRVPELLAQHGVVTVQEAGFIFLAGSFGVTGKFQEEHEFGATKNAAPAVTLVNAMLDRLRHTPTGPIFLYTHLAEPHGPYHLGKGVTNFDHYLNAVVEADRQVGRLLAYLEQHYGDRWALLVSADHGESFGDHQTTDHAKTLYEELLHVPLVVRSPRCEHRRVDARVGLVDLGPTLLDLFQVETPASFEGQSLVPFLAGGDVALTRPLLAEGRLRRAYTAEDGFKVIEDPRRKVVETYDLARTLKKRGTSSRATFHGAKRRSPAFEPSLRPRRDGTTATSRPTSPDAASDGSHRRALVRDLAP